MFLPDDNRVFKPSQVAEVLEEIDFKHMLVSGGTMINNEYKKVDYYNIPCSFDIETSSFYYKEDGTQCDYEEKERQISANRALGLDRTHDPIKVSTMYVWQFNIYGRCFMGRTWQEFKQMLKMFRDLMGIDFKRRLIIYVHNLSYETGFIQKQLSIETMFATEMRNVLYFVTKSGFEFRCSFMLSQMSLKHVGEKLLLKYPAKKLVGDLDYNLVRHSLTPLTENEIQYCVNDVRIVTNYIQEQIEQYGKITKIPLTNTGVARIKFRSETLKFPDTNVKNYAYIDLMRKLTFNTVIEYKLNNQAYMGGFTHANPYYIDCVVENVASFDIVSSYPAVMVMEKYPMGKGVNVKIESLKQLDVYLRQYCLVFRVRFHHLEATFFDDNYISMSKCIINNGYGKDEKGKEIRPPVTANGRLVSVNDKSTVDMVLTNVDFEIIRKTYKWDNIQIGTCYAYEKGYLPTPFIRCLLELYEKKNTLKGNEDKLLEYMISKAIVNSSYGMAGENPIKDIITFDVNNVDNLWTSRQQTDDELLKSLEDYNNKSNRFIFFPWAVFITAYARKNLWEGILNINKDYCYSDTDSLKIINYESHLNFFENYKQNVIKKLTRACEYHDIPLSKVCHKGRYLGQFDFEGVYPRFKTLGAKRYMVQSPCGRYAKTGEPLLADVIDGAKIYYSLSLTVSGVNKYDAVPYLLKKYNYDAGKIFDAFTDGMIIPASYTGKLLHTYIDEETKGIVKDYLGNTYTFHEKTSVHLEPTTYKISSLAMLFDYARGLRQRIN